MTNPTSNFGWAMPTATDLVTDLPADFEVFGQAVDTDFAGLNGGTTGQVLSKTSGTDLAFTWVDTDDTNAIQNAIVTAKGDLIGASASATPARLAVGTDGQTLVADSAEATGLKWATAAGGGKLLQVVTAVNTTSYYSTSATYGDTGLTATITPTSASSTILVMVSQFCRAVRNSTQQGFGIKLFRDATDIWENPYAGSIAASASTIEVHGVIPVIYIDSPATTSATTYKTQGKPYDNSSGGSAEYQFQSKPSTITLFEIGA